MFENKEWLKIINKKSGKIIAAGQVISKKDYSNGVNCNCISFDGKWFFNTKSTLFYIENNSECIKVDFNSEKDYPFVVWGEKLKNNSADLYRDYDITELDPEVKRLVAVLNKFDGIRTINSCSGHNDYSLQVSITFLDLRSIAFICKIIHNKFKDDFTLSTLPNLYNNQLDTVSLDLHTMTKGKEAYKKANELADELEKYVGVFQ